jgi:hypothetical protein
MGPIALLTLALKAVHAVTRLMRVLIAIAPAVAIRIATGAGLVAGILRRTLAVAIAEFLLPSFGGWTGAGLLTLAILLPGLEVLRLVSGGHEALAVILHVSGELGALLGRFSGLVLPLAAPPAAAFGLPHAMRYAMPGFLRRTNLPAHLLLGRGWRTLVYFHLGYILL